MFFFYFKFMNNIHSHLGGDANISACAHYCVRALAKVINARSMFVILSVATTCIQ